VLSDSSPSASIPDVLIVGGGIHGCALARELALRGREVLVLERSVPGAEASSAAGGILGPHLEAEHGPEFLRLGRYSLALYPEWVAQLEAESGLDVGFVRCGGLRGCFKEEGLRGLRGQAQQMAEAGLPARWLSPEACLELEPNLGAVLGGIHFPEEAQVDPRRLMAALTVAAAKAGVTFVSDTVLALDEDKLRVHCASGPRRAKQVVLAAGAWTTTLPGTGLSSSCISPARGQMLALQCEQPLAKAVLFSERGYVVPRTDGSVLVGSTLEFVGFEKAVTLGGIRDITETGLQLLPNLNAARLSDAWSGFRPWTSDHLPLLGAAARDGLWLSAGHYRNGILLAPASARLLADSMTGEAPALPLGPFSPARFAAH
jgi:glycine oxidase